jgi:hypothetical protein
LLPIKTTRLLTFDKEHAIINNETSLLPAQGRINERDVIIIAAWEHNVPTPETPAQRYERTEHQMRGDWQLKANVANNLEVAGKLVYDADGRYERKFDHRGGEIYGTETGEWHEEVDGRNSRIYVDPKTKLSAENGKKSEVWDSPAVHRN